MTRFAKFAYVLGLAGVLSASPLYAQVAGRANSPQPTNVAGSATLGTAQNGFRQNVVAQQQTQAGQVPQGWTLSKGRHIAFGSNSDKKDQELIMMYMKDFHVYRTPSGQTRCSMQFAVVSTLPEKISNISYRLQWPEMNTVLSFSGIQPEVENHYNYSLLGDGCYSMDKAPNIVINRCRVKGMSQRDCASKVRWITRSL